MNLTIAALLAQDGITNGAIYALLALALVMVFAVTRVIWVPAGEFVSYGTLTLAALQLGKAPGTVGLLVGMALIAGAMEAWSCFAQGHVRGLPRRLIVWTVVPLAIAELVHWLAPLQPPFVVQIALTLAAVTALGPLLYRIVYQPLVDASVLVLLIVSVAVHFALTGLGLWFFGAEGSRTPPFSEARIDIGGLAITGQSLVVVGVAAVLVVLMFLFFERSIVGKALRATAMNRVGARLMGIPTDLSGDLSFALAALIGAVSGLLIAPLTTVYYDTGFLIGLKGFVAAIVGGLASYPIAVLGALLVGQLEAFSSFWASAFKEVLVFTLIIPVLWWRSLRSRHVEDEE